MAYEVISIFTQSPDPPSTTSKRNKNNVDVRRDVEPRRALPNLNYGHLATSFRMNH